MGTWGIYNMDNDDAADYLNDLIKQLVLSVKEVMSSDSTQSEEFLDHYGEVQVMPAIDIILTLCTQYRTVPSLDIEILKAWEKNYLDIYDNYISLSTPDEAFIAQRRYVIKTTFERLEMLIQKI
jgi:hypothetical protein